MYLSVKEKKFYNLLGAQVSLKMEVQALLHVNAAVAIRCLKARRRIDVRKLIE